MANTIKLKRSSVAGKVPLISDLDYGEVSINYTDGTLYYKDSSGSINAIGSNIGNTVVKGNITANTSGTRATFANVITTQGIFWANGVNYSTSLGGGSFSGGIVTSSIYPNGNVTLNLGTDTAFWGTTFTGNLTANVVIASGVNLLSNVGSLANSIYTLDANVGAYELYANANAATQATSLNSINANVGAYQTWANGRIITLDANLGTATTDISNLVTQANANTTALLAGSVTTGPLTVDSRAGGYFANISGDAHPAYGRQTWKFFSQPNPTGGPGSWILFPDGSTQTTAYPGSSTSLSTFDANLGTLTLGNISTQANLGSYQTYANASVVAIQANLGSYQIYANANAATQAVSINSLASNANVNVAAYLAGGTITSNIVTTANAIIGNVQTTGKVYVGDITNAVPYIMGSGAFHVAGGMSIAKDFWIGGNLYVANIISQATTILEVSDPLVYLNSDSPTYNYDIGIFSQFVNPNNGLNNYTGAIRSYIHNYWGFFSNVTAKPASGAVDFADPGIVWDTVKAGDLIVGNATPSTSYASGALRVSGGAGIAGAVNIGGNLTVIGNLTVQGNTITIGSNNLTVSDSIIDLHTQSNLAVLTTDDGRDIGLRFHYYKGSDAHAFLGWENDVETLIYLQRSSELNSNITGTPGNVKFGSLLLSNTTSSTSATAGALQVSGGAGISGNVWSGGQLRQDSAKVAIGHDAGATDQSTLTVAIGDSAGFLSQCACAVAIGSSAGRCSQSAGAIAIGQAAGYCFQGIGAIAIGSGAGQICGQGACAVAIGTSAGNNNQAACAVAVGAGSGNLGQSTQAVAVGYQAGRTSQGTNAVAIGSTAGQCNQNTSAVAIGNGAGSSSQKASAVAIGNGAGSGSQSIYGIAIGYNAGHCIQSTNAIAIGRCSGFQCQRPGAVAIGYNAGQFCQGADSIAIGRNAGVTQTCNSIVINASGVTLNPTTSGFYVDPIRSATAGNVVVYDTTTKELTYTTLTTGITYTASTSAPVSPVNGDQWYKTSANILYEYITDGSTSFWLDIQSPVVTANVPAGATNLIIQDEGSSLVTTPNTINFVGTGVSATNSGNVVTVTVPGLIIKDEGSSLVTAANTINFVGTGVSATNSGNVVTVTVNTPDTLSPFLLMGA
jgi:hypothetical protein